MGKNIIITEEQFKNYILFEETKNFLNESLSTFVYHFTTLQNLYNIVNKDSIILSSSFENKTDSYLGHKYPFFMSLTRSFNSKIGYPGYMNSKFKNNKNSHNISDSLNVRIEFDGNKLNNNHKGMPVNYHWRSNTSNKQQIAIKKELGDDFNGNFETKLIAIRQDEDRLLSTKQEIKDISQYIIKIDICLSMDGFNNNLSKPIISAINEILLKEKFKNKIFIYPNENSFNNPNSQNYIKNFTEQYGNYLYSSIKKRERTITERNLKSIGGTIKYIYLIDNTTNINNIIEYMANVLLNEIPNKNYIINKIQEGFDLELTSEEIDKILKFLKNDFREEFRYIYMELLKLLTNAFSKYINNKNNSKSIYYYLNNLKKRKDDNIIAPTFRNMIKYFNKA